MRITDVVRRILSGYSSECPGSKANLARILMSGKLAGSGKLVILPVDQGFEHGPIRSFLPNQSGYDPFYHANLAIEAGLSAYAAPLGMLEMVADDYASQIPLILKMNSGNSLFIDEKAPDQAMVGSIDDALKLGCLAVGFTIYPGSENANYMISEVAELIKEAKSCGLVTVVWSYPRGGSLNKNDETSLDVICYAAHIAALIGAHIIKVKLPSDLIENKSVASLSEKYTINKATLADRVKLVMQSSFDSNRLVVFSGGETKDLDKFYQEIKSIKNGGGNGSIIGRNTFQRPKNQAIEMLTRIINIYLNKDE